MTDRVATPITDLEPAYQGSWYTISGTADPLEEWIDGYEGILRDHEVGQPTTWYVTTGACINEYAGDTSDPYPEDLPVLMFPLDHLNIATLAVIKIGMHDRWFDDIIDNMRRRGREAQGG